MKYLMISLLIILSACASAVKVDKVAKVKNVYCWYKVYQNGVEVDFVYVIKDSTECKDYFIEQGVYFNLEVADEEW